METLLETLKYVSLTIALLAGLIAAATQTRDKDTARLTRWGWCAVAVLLASSAISGVSEYFDRQIKADRAKDERDAAAATKATLEHQLDLSEGLRKRTDELLAKAEGESQAPRWVENANSGDLTQGFATAARC